MRGHPQRVCPRGTDAAGAGRVSGEGLALGALDRFCAPDTCPLCRVTGGDAQPRVACSLRTSSLQPCPAEGAGSRRGRSRAGGRAVLQQRQLHRGLLLWALPGTGDPSSELKWACSGEHFSRDSRRDVRSPGSTGMGTTPQDSPAPGAAGCVARLGTGRAGNGPACLHKRQWPGEGQGPRGRASLARWCLGRGSLPRSLLRA